MIFFHHFIRFSLFISEFRSHLISIHQFHSIILVNTLSYYHCRFRYTPHHIRYQTRDFTQMATADPDTSNKDDKSENSPGNEGDEKSDEADRAFEVSNE